MIYKPVFTCKPFRAAIEGKAEPVECQAYIFDGRNSSGLEIHFNGGIIVANITNGDPIYAWRVAEAFPCIEGVISKEMVPRIMLAVNRMFCDNASARDIPISSKAYREIMQKPVPDEIVEAIIRKEEGNLVPGLDSLQREVKEGTVAWQERFALCGINYPIRSEKRIKEDAAIIARLRPILRPYEEFLGIKDMTLENLIEKNSLVVVRVTKGYPDEVIVAAVGAMCAAGYYYQCAPNENSFETKKRDAIDKSVEWLTKKKGWTEELSKKAINELCDVVIKP